MTRGPSGTYRETSAFGDVVRVFIPDALPPRDPIVMDDDLQRRYEQALLACGRLDGISALLPDRGLFLYAYVRREAVVSSQIEGTQSSLSDLLLFELEEIPGVPFDDVQEVSNYVAAMNHGLMRLQNGFPLSNRLIREVHEILMQKGRGSAHQPGEFRKSQNWIGGTRPGNAHFVPPSPDLVTDCMGDLERFLHTDATSALIKAAMAHVQFETIHPFLDGNGRTGRLLIALILHQEGVLRDPLLYLSLFLKQNRDRYYTLLDHVRNNGDWESWLAFFFEGVMVTSNGAVNTAHRLLDRMRLDEDQIRQLGRPSHSVMRSFAALRSRPVLNIETLADLTGLTFPTAAKTIDLLTSLGIVHEITGKQRGRVFAYTHYLNILNEGGEPL